MHVQRAALCEFWAALSHGGAHRTPMRALVHGFEGHREEPLVDPLSGF